jgi:SAM-dependent methyltransferase
VSKPLPNCIVCGKATARERHDWLFRCTVCGFLSSSLEPRINAATARIDEEKREHALNSLRRRNFETILDWLAETGVKPPARILEIGCGHGWFLLAARARGYEPIGIEPDGQIAAIAQANGVNVRRGFFPEATVPGEIFDVVIFNDVFEHLPDPPGVLRAVRNCLAHSGVLAINLPLATGMFYRVSDALGRVGWHGPFERMWQVGFPSPHRSYFSAPQLAALAEQCGFTERARRSMPSLRVSGLWERLCYDPDQSRVAAALMWPLLVGLAPLVRFLPADIGVQLFSPPSDKP